MRWRTEPSLTLYIRAAVELDSVGLSSLKVVACAIASWSPIDLGVMMLSCCDEDRFNGGD
jgi:hypothetical protein